MTQLTIESYYSELTPDVVIANAAQAHGISLEQDRSEQLAGLARRMQERGTIPASTFSDTTNGVYVRQPAFSDRFRATAASMDFIPILEEDGDLVSGAAPASSDRATIYTQLLIRGLQNYVLFAEAGFVERPGVLVGDTNPQMAIVAERFGMFSDISRQYSGAHAMAHQRVRQMSKIQINGTFGQVSERVFSEGVQKLDLLLTRRLAAKSAGATALIS